MSFLLVHGLRVQCPKCMAIRKIALSGGPRYLQVGDANAMLHRSLWEWDGAEDQGLFRIDAWCASCAEPILVSKPQVLAEEREDLLAEIQDWTEELREKGTAWLLNHAIPSPGSRGATTWLKGNFPSLFQGCFEDARCGLYPAFFTKMKKRFGTQAGRCIERDGMPLPAAFIKWLEAERSNHPFKESLVSLQERSNALAKKIPGPWPLVERRDAWQGLNLNPYLSYEGTTFMAGGDPGAELYFIYQETHRKFASTCASALEKPFQEANRFFQDTEMGKGTRRILQAFVGALEWPLDSEA